MRWYNKYSTITTDKKWKGLIREVYNFAFENSNDISTFTAAMLVDNKLNNLAIASNGFPVGAKAIEGWDQKPKKDQISNHSERAVIYKAAKKGIKTDGLTMIMPWAPCYACANAIIYSGIETLVCHKQMVDRTPVDWESELADCFKILRKNKIKIIMYDGKIGTCKGFMRKEYWEP
jgi:deoxycytidylate deaminase